MIFPLIFFCLTLFLFSIVAWILERPDWPHSPKLNSMGRPLLSFPWLFCFPSSFVSYDFLFCFGTSYLLGDANKVLSLKLTLEGWDFRFPVPDNFAFSRVLSSAVFPLILGRVASNLCNTCLRRDSKGRVSSDFLTVLCSCPFIVVFYISPSISLV